MRDLRVLILCKPETWAHADWVDRLARELKMDGYRVKIVEAADWIRYRDWFGDFDQILVVGSPQGFEKRFSDLLGEIVEGRFVPWTVQRRWFDAVPPPFSGFHCFNLTELGSREGRSTRSPGTGGGGLAYANEVADNPGERYSVRDEVKHEASEPEPAPVQVTTVSPTAVEPGARFHVEVVFHVEGFEVEAEEGRRVDEAVTTLALREGARLTVRLVSVDEGAFAIDDPEAPVVWGPPSRRVDFRLRAAQDLEAGVHDLRVEHWCGEVQLARTYLEITVGRQPEAETEPSVTRRPLPRSAFASYAHADKVAVAGRVDSLKAVGIDVFLDSLDIRQDADWRGVLERELLGRDSLLLFWSTAAKASEWVEREWRFALENRGLEGIIPNALEPADACPPPKELASLQFGSVLTELSTRWRRDAAGREPLL